MRLSRPSIIRELESGHLSFTPPLEPDQIGASSIDLRLGETFIHLDRELAEERDAGANVQWYVQDAKWDTFAEKYGRTDRVAVGGRVEIPPGRLILGFTQEYVRLPPTLAGRVEGKSSIARRGLLIHVTAPTIQVGFEGQIQLEFYNLGPAPLLLLPGRPICQLVLEQVTDAQQYAGQFSKQRG